MALSRWEDVEDTAWAVNISEALDLPISDKLDDEDKGIDLDQVVATFEWFEGYQGSDYIVFVFRDGTRSRTFRQRWRHRYNY